MKIDFSWSIDQWMQVIQDFIQILSDFFAKLGITLFEEDAAPEAPEEETNLPV